MTTDFLALFLRWLLLASLRASLLALATVCLQFALGRFLPARWRYALWLPTVFVLVAPVLPTGPWQFGNRLLAVPFVIQAREAAPVASPPSPSLPTGTGVTAASSGGLDRGTVLFAVWLAGTAGCLAAGAVGYRRALRRFSRHAVAADPQLAALLSFAGRQVGLRNVPRVLVSTAVESPAVTGLLRPLLLLPAGFPAGFTSAEAQLILLHECTHLRRLDLPVNALLCVFQAAHWFNPWMWFVFARLRADREAACDARVLSLQVGDCRAEYGRALLKLGGAPSARLGLAFVGIFERAGLRSRLTAIARHRRTHPVWTCASVALIGALFLLGATGARSADDAPAAGSGKAEGREPQVVVHARFLEIPRTDAKPEFEVESNHASYSKAADGNTGYAVFTQSATESADLLRHLEELGARTLTAPLLFMPLGHRGAVYAGEGGKSTQQFIGAGSPSASLAVMATLAEGGLKVEMEVTCTSETHLKPGAAPADSAEKRLVQYARKYQETIKPGETVTFLCLDQSKNERRAWPLVVSLTVELIPVPTVPPAPANARPTRRHEP